MAWPDIVVGIILALGTFNGWRVGLVAELTGMIAIVAAIAAAFSYSGGWDPYLRAHVHLGAGSAHVLGMFAYAAVAYALVAAVGFVLGRFAKLPIIGTVNAALGSALGLVKSVLFVWVVLYIALFFPLSPDLRADLHRSILIGMIASRNEGLDRTLRTSLPPFVQPISNDVFARHRM